MDKRSASSHSIFINDTLTQLVIDVSFHSDELLQDNIRLFLTISPIQTLLTQRINCESLQGSFPMLFLEFHTRWQTGMKSIVSVTPWILLQQRKYRPHMLFRSLEASSRWRFCLTNSRRFWPSWPDQIGQNLHSEVFLVKKPSVPFDQCATQNFGDIYPRFKLSRIKVGHDRCLDVIQSQYDIMMASMH